VALERIDQMIENIFRKKYGLGPAFDLHYAYWCRIYTMTPAQKKAIAHDFITVDRVFDEYSVSLDHAMSIVWHGKETAINFLIEHKVSVMPCQFPIDSIVSNKPLCQDEEYLSRQIVCMSRLLANEGQITPVLLCNDHLIDGWVRVKAAKVLGWKKVMVNFV
jgi:hypothetical protein